MKKFIIFFTLLHVFLFARYEAKPIKICPAFNNMKHTKNSHNIMLDLNTKYTILDHHKGQHLLLIKGEQPSQRWVDESCFLKNNSTLDVDNSLNSYINKIDKKEKVSSPEAEHDYLKISHNNLLALSWHNAFCETHRRKQECKRDLFTLFRSKHREHNFILHGLWPQPKNRVYCGLNRKYITMDKYKHWNKLPDLILDPETRKNLKKIMPGVASNLHKHEWIKHGTCYGTDANTYFSEAISLVEEFYSSDISKFFQKNVGKRLTLKQVRVEFDKSFGEGAGKSVEMRCKNGLITELWLHLGKSHYDLGKKLKNGEASKKSCQRGILDKAGYGR